MNGARAEVRAVEIRSYTLHPGTRADFHRLMSEQAVPDAALLAGRRGRPWALAARRRQLSLIRAYLDLAERETSQDAFYGSAERRDGPREPILASIAHFSSIVLLLDEAAIVALRDALPR